MGSMQLAVRDVSLYPGQCILTREIAQIFCKIYRNLMHSIIETPFEGPIDKHLITKTIYHSFCIFEFLSQ